MNKPLLRIVCVTGATSGIGKAVAQLFAKRGYSLIITGRREDRLAELKEQWELKYGIQIRALHFDIRDAKACKDAFESLEQEWRAIHILINNAGLAKGFAPLHEGDIEDWDQMIDTNVKGLLYFTRQVVPGMVKRQEGHIINVASIAGKQIYPNGNVYCASKSAVDAITRSLRLELLEYGIRVGQVSPGHVEETEFASVRFDGDEEKAKIYGDFNPLTSRDVAEMIYFIVTRPKHVNVFDIEMTGTQQADVNHIHRSGREKS